MRIVRGAAFCEELSRDMIVHPVSLAVAQLAGRIEGEQAAMGITIDFEDLLIGATALNLGFDVATINVKHFQQIPGLKVVAL
jgi:tRNA(fMet)-specific endonuclease VapC